MTTTTDRHHRRDTRPWLALGAMLVLQYASFGLHYLGFTGYTALALAIAGVMVLVNAMVFMDLRSAVPATRLVGVLSVLFIVLLCLGVAGDVALR
jgi:hypothetical protein